MKKIDATIIKETRYILYWMLVLSALTQAVFLVIGRWDHTVLLGNLLSGATMVLNFFLMGLFIQSAVSKNEEDAKKTLKLSQTYRFLILIAVLAVGVGLPSFSTWTVIIPMFFPRIAIAFRPLFDKKGS